MTPQVLYRFPQCAGDQFMPSNGTEGEIFVDAFCAQCMHEKFIHTGKHCDKKCEIFSRSIIHWMETVEQGYPKEWIFNEEGWPVCTSWKKWDWGFDDETGEWNDPPEPDPIDPMQLCLPFEIEFIEQNTIKINQPCLANAATNR